MSFDPVSYAMGAKSGGGGSGSSDVYKPGDTIDLSGYIYGIGVASANPYQLAITFIMPKTNANSLQITHTLTVAWLRGGGTSYSGSIKSVTMTGNVMMIKINPEGSLPDMTVLAAAIAGVITFGEPQASGGA